MKTQPGLLESGQLSFTIESRIVRELGERLVKQPQVALLELIKNAFDADATKCVVDIGDENRMIVSDNGSGMTIDEFRNGWMRIGTSSKETKAESRRYRRIITGEKGIGRFAVRFLGRSLRLESVAMDTARGHATLLTAEFDWPSFDKNEDLGKIHVPYTVSRAPGGASSGTKLIITDLRPGINQREIRSVKTSVMGMVSPFQSLVKGSTTDAVTPAAVDSGFGGDNGFTVIIQDQESEEPEGSDIASNILENYVLKSLVWTEGNRLHLQIFSRHSKKPIVSINNKIDNLVGSLYADIRYFPQRAGVFRGLGVDGRRAKSWVKENGGVAVFDRGFRIHPYGTRRDDWLQLAADKAKNLRDPRSSIAQTHFAMEDSVRKSTRQNYMLLLPYPEQLVGVVQVEGRRTSEETQKAIGLIPAADREGYLHNAAFDQLWDIIRGAIESMASVDRDLQLQEKKREEEALLTALRAETQEAIKEIQDSPSIPRSEKAKIVKYLTNTQNLAEQQGEVSRQRAATMEIMSLLGVVAGFMTHEFGTALDDLEQAHLAITKASKKNSELKGVSSSIGEHIGSLKEFVSYSKGYIHGASSSPPKPYPARPRISQVIRVFGKYADDRQIQISIDIPSDLHAPLVPLSLYNGLALNLYSNALKAVTSKAGGKGHREIAFRAWNEGEWHFLEVSDTGIGIPNALKARVFDPLFTTTAQNADPLGSGMGLGLSLVHRGVTSFGGTVEIVEPPPEFSTCFRIKLPLAGE